MSSKGGMRWYGWAVLACVAAVAVAGCRKPVVTKTVAVSTTTAADEALDSAIEALARQTDLASCKAAVQQLNVQLGRHPEQRQHLDAKDKERLQTLLALTNDELAEIDSATFTPLDTYYLDGCFLLRDAARALDVDNRPPSEQATAAFNWLIRQVRLEERPDQLIPEPFILRRGRGSAVERSLIFLGLLDQLGIDGALVSVPAASGNRRWLPCALAGKDIFLFDSGLGLPLPSGDGKPATLAQIRANGDSLRRLSVDPKSPYDLTAEQLKKAEIFVGCPLSALAPRMKYLEGALSALNRVRLTCDLSARLERFKAAAGSDVPVHSFDGPGDVSAPTRILRQFLPPAEGGADTVSYPVALLKGFRAPSDDAMGGPLPRRYFFEYELTPWTFLPEQVRQIPFGVDLGARPRRLFQLMFVSFFTGPDQPRNTMLRGQPDEAIRQLVALRDELRRAQEALGTERTLEADVAAWSAHAQQTQANYLRAREKAARDPGAAEALDRARAEIDAMWKAGQKPLGMLLAKAWAEPLGVEVDYYLALCKHEQAERLEAARNRPGAGAAEARAADEAWASAANWWETFTRDHPKAPAVAAARALHARACEARHQLGKAAELLADLSGPLTALEKTGRLYRARQLKDGNK